jgi:hypothetical protein
MNNGNTLTSTNGAFTLTVGDDGIRLSGPLFFAILNMTALFYRVGAAA